MNTSEPDYRQMLDEARFVMKQRRGWFGRIRDDDRLSGSAPSDDTLQTQWEENQYLLRRGQIVWGAFVQANKVLFRYGTENAPGEIICSTDSHFDENPDELVEIATAIYELKGARPSDPKLRKIAEEITGEMARAFGEPVPAAFTRRMTVGQEVRRYSMVFDRGHLPEGVIAQRLFPVLTHARCRSVCFLPASCWGPALRAFWKLSDQARMVLKKRMQQREAQRKSLPVVRATKAAAAKLREVHKTTGRSELIVRLGLDSGTYKLGFLDRSEISRDDLVVQNNEVLMVVSKSDADTLWGTELDFVDQGQKRGFQFNEYVG